MGVPTTLRGISGTASNNSPAGTDAVGSTADDYLRGIQASFRQYLAGQSSTVTPSAGVADLTTATGHWVPIAGTSTITGLGSEAAGIEYVLAFSANPLLLNSTALACPSGANLQANTADYCVAESLGGGNWRLWGLTRAADKFSLLTEDTAPDLTADFVETYDNSATTEKKVLLGRLNGTLGTKTATTSGTTVDFTGLPAWIKRITIMLVGVSTSGASDMQIQIGDSSSGIETTGYLGAGNRNGGAVTSTANFTTGFGIHSGAATSVIHGSMTLTLVEASSNTWVASSNFGFSDTAQTLDGGGSKALAGTLDRVRLTTVNGTDTFDAGAMNILYE